MQWLLVHSDISHSVAIWQAACPTFQDYRDEGDPALISQNSRFCGDDRHGNRQAQYWVIKVNPYTCVWLSRRQKAFTFIISLDLYSSSGRWGWHLLLTLFTKQGNGWHWGGVWSYSDRGPVNHRILAHVCLSLEDEKEKEAGGVPCWVEGDGHSTALGGAGRANGWGPRPGRASDPPRPLNHGHPSPGQATQ